MDVVKDEKRHDFRVFFDFHFVLHYVHRSMVILNVNIVKRTAK